MLERLRNPTWIAIGFAAIVVAGVTWKLLATGEEAPTVDNGKKVATTVPELGRYELEETSWHTATAATSSETTKTEARPTVQPKREQRRWSGICVAIQRN